MIIKNLLVKPEGHNGLYRNVVDELKSNISYTTFKNHLNYLVEKKIIDRKESSENKNRLKRVLYFITEKGKKEFNLEILDTRFEVNVNRKLFQLLLYFDNFKRGNKYTERQLKTFLKKIGTSFDELIEYDMDIENNKKNTVLPLQDPDISINKVYTTHHNVSVINITEHNKTYFYCVLPGFSIEEFVDYMTLLKKGREPRPFAKFPTTLEIPYVSTEFSIRDVGHVTNILRKNVIIKPIMSILKNEERYGIHNDSLKELITLYWFLHKFDYHISMRNLFNKKSVEKNRQLLKLYHGERIVKYLMQNIDAKKQSKKNEGIIEDDVDISDLLHNRNIIKQKIDDYVKRLHDENDLFIISIINEICDNS